MTTDYQISRDTFQARHYRADTDMTIFLDGDLDRKTRISVMSGREFTITLEDLIAVLRQREINVAKMSKPLNPRELDTIADYLVGRVELAKRNESR